MLIKEMTPQEIRVLQEFRRLSAETMGVATITAIKHPIGGGDVPTIVSHLHDVNALVAINRTLDRLTARGYHITVRVAGVKRDDRIA